MATYINNPQETKVHQIHTIRQCTTQIGPSINKRNCVLSYNSPLANNTVSSHFRASFLLKLSKEPRKRERRRFMESTEEMTKVGRKVFNPLLFYAVKPIHQTSLKYPSRHQVIKQISKLVTKQGSSHQKTKGKKNTVQTIYKAFCAVPDKFHNSKTQSPLTESFS